MRVEGLSDRDAPSTALHSRQKPRFLSAESQLMSEKRWTIWSAGDFFQ